MSDLFTAWLASQRALVERWCAVPPGGPMQSGIDADTVLREAQQWWQGVMQGASPQAQALARQLMDLGPGFLAGSGGSLFDVFGFAGAAGEEPSSGPWPDQWSQRWSQQWSTVRWMDFAPIGYWREHQSHAQELARALQEYGRVMAEMAGVLTRVHTQALELLAAKVEALAASGETVSDTRRLYDLWIECGEQAFAHQVHTEPFSRIQGQMMNATLRVRAAQQAIVEQFSKALDLPTRAELNSVHRRLQELRARIEAIEQEHGKQKP